MAIEFNDDQHAELVKLLGVPEADGNDPAALLTVLADVVEQASHSTEDPKPSKVASIAAKIGMEVIDSDSIAALRRDAEEGRRLTAQIARTKVENTVDDAIRRGKITPARRKHWIDLISADSAMSTVLNGIPDETAVPLGEVGHADGDTDNVTQAAGWFR